MSILDDVSPAAAVDQLRRQASLIGREEREERWEARSCHPSRMTPQRADRLFFSLRGVRPALAMCAACPARVLCALRALEEEATSDYLPEGTVGGLTATDRVRILLATSNSIERTSA